MPISKNFILKEVSGDYMIIPLSDTGIDFSHVFNINESAAIIYKALDENKTIDEVIKVVMDEYEADYDVVKEDVLELIEEFKRRGIYLD